jgi:hypothetical protein
MSDSATTYLGFSSNNFYYVNAKSKGSEYAPDSSCNDVFNNHGVFNNIKCDHSLNSNGTINFQDNSFNCLKKVMCENKKLAESLSIEHNNRGSDVKYLDNKTSYNIYLIKTANLLLGISAILYFMYNSKSTTNNNSNIQNNIN